MRVQAWLSRDARDPSAVILLPFANRWGCIRQGLVVFPIAARELSVSFHSRLLSLVKVF